MERTYLGNSGIQVSRISMGTMTMGGQADQAESHRMLDYCWDRGIDFYDTANMYNAGRSEEILGAWLARHPGRREECTIASKVRYPVGDDERTIGLSRPVIMRELDRTLRRMRTDYLDIYYLHAPDHHTRIEESLLTMDALVRSGRVRTIGMSNYAAWQMVEAILKCDAVGWARPTVVQPMLNLIARGIESEIVPACRAYGMGTCVYNPLAGGLLTGKHRADQAPEAGGRFATNRYYRDRFWHDEHFEAVWSLREVAEKEGRSLIALAYGWLLDHSAVDCLIVGASSMTQLETNVAALDEAAASELSTEAREACDAVHARLRGFPPRVVR